MDIYAGLEDKTALASGALRFRTMEQKFESNILDSFKAAEGVTIPSVLFELLPMTSSPCDLYALGVIAVETMMVNASTTLAMALDEALSLARQIALEHDESKPLADRIVEIFSKDDRWSQSLGPHRILHEEIDSAQAASYLPPELWFDALAMIVRLFPGMGPDSDCQDYGYCPSGGLHQVYDKVTEALDSLLLRTRCLLINDWQHNHEIKSLINNYLAEITDQEPSAPVGS